MGFTMNGKQSSPDDDRMQAQHMLCSKKAPVLINCGFDGSHNMVTFCSLHCSALVEESSLLASLISQNRSRAL